MIKNTPRLSRALFCCAWLLLACGSSAPDGAASSVVVGKGSSPRYTAHFDAKLEPELEHADVTLQIEQSRALLLELTLRMPESRYTVLDSDGVTKREGQYVSWQVPAQGGVLRYRYKVTNKRNSGAVGRCHITVSVDFLSIITCPSRHNGRGNFQLSS